MRRTCQDLAWQVKPITKPKICWREGIAFHIEGLVADGDPVPEPSARVMTLPISA